MVPSEHEVMYDVSGGGTRAVQSVSRRALGSNRRGATGSRQHIMREQRAALSSPMPNAYDSPRRVDERATFDRDGCCGGRRKTHTERQTGSVSDRSLCGQQAASTHMSEHERVQWARGHGTMLDLERREGGQTSVGQQGRISGGAHGSARRKSSGGGLLLFAPCAGCCVGRVNIWVPGVPAL